jgi:hypothetical protein
MPVRLGPGLHPVKGDTFADPIKLAVKLFHKVGMSRHDEKQPTATAAARRAILFRARDLPRERAPVLVGVTVRHGIAGSRCYTASQHRLVERKASAVRHLRKSLTFERTRAHF